MAKQVFLSVLLILCILKFGDGYYWYWYTTDRMKTKILFIGRELVNEAIRNYQRIDHMREYYSYSHIYDIGQMLYFIRSKFARMVRLYILSIENNDKFKNFHLHLPYLKEMHHLGMEVYNLIEMLEEDDASLKFTPKRKKKTHKSSNKTLSSTENSKNSIPPKFLRQRPIGIPSFAKHDFYARKPNSAVRNRMKVNRGRDIDAAFDSDVE